MSLLEVQIALAVVAVMLLSAGVAFSASMRTMRSARDLTGAAVFLETVMDSVAAQDYGNLLSLNGNVITDAKGTSGPRYAVALNVFDFNLQLRQVDAQLTDANTGQILATVTTLRSDR